MPSSLDGTILYVGGSGTGNYTKIQDAVDASNPGDTVYVYNDSAPYHESVIVDKSISLVGEEASSTEINGSTLDPSLDIMTVLAEGVSIRGFRISHNVGEHYQAAVKIKAKHTVLSHCIFNQNGWVGVFLANVSFCRIADCDLYGNLVAIYLVNSRYNILQNLSCHDNSDAITVFESSNDNQIIHCTCSQNHFDSILIQQSSGNQIIDCVCQDGYDGISLPYAPNTTLRNNSLLNNYVNFGIGSSSVSDFYCDIDTSNTINGKPMYYLIEQDHLTFDETTEVGFLGLVNCHNITVKNSGFSMNFEGILLAGTRDSTIENCSFYRNDGHGMYLISCRNTTVDACTFQDGFWDGVFLYDSVDNKIKNCAFQGSLAGVNLGSSTSNLIQGAIIEDCSVGVKCDASGNNILRNNVMLSCGIHVLGNDPAEFRNDVDPSNTVNSRPVYYYINQTNRTVPSDAGQIMLINCSGCIVSNCNLSNASVGLELAYCSMNIIEDNILANNSVVAITLDGKKNNENHISDNFIRGNNYGIDVDSSNMNLFQGNLLTRNGMGISFDSCWNNTINGNTIQDGSYGLSFEASTSNVLTNNTIRDADVFGLYLLSSDGNVLRINAMVNCSLMMYGADDTKYRNSIDTTNTVNEKPLYFISDQTKIIVPDNAGEVILLDSDHCIIKNLSLDKGTVGVILAYSSHNIIYGNSIMDQSITALDLSAGGNDNNIISGNIIRGNGYGIDLENSKSSLIWKNQITSNGYGIYLFNTRQAFIWRNTLSTNSYGISVSLANDSKIFLNNFYQNYAYGLTAEACVVSASWNWWGSTTGPNSDGNADHLKTTKEGRINYTPWLRSPVLFTGLFRLLSTEVRSPAQKDTLMKKPMVATLEQPLSGLFQANVFGFRSIHPATPHNLPRTNLEPQYSP